MLINLESKKEEENTFCFYSYGIYVMTIFGILDYLEHWIDQGIEYIHTWGNS